MKNVLLLIIFSFVCFHCTAQKKIKIIFETQTIIKEESLKKLPEYIRADAVKQLQSVRKVSYMTIQSNKVYYEMLAQNIDVNKKGLIDRSGSENGILFAKDLSMSTSIRAVKLIKDYKTNTFIVKIKNKLVTEKLPVIEWNFTSKQKNILGYVCNEATTTFKNQLLTVYYTKEFKVAGSPSTLPFIDGVVLAFNYGHNFSTAVKIDMNQQLITNFL